MVQNNRIYGLISVLQITYLKSKASSLLKVLGVFKIPVISYGATSVELSDKVNYEYFSRTIPSDMYQTKAIVEILDYFNWTYVSVVYTKESYGQNGFDLLKKEAEKYGKKMRVFL